MVAELRKSVQSCGFEIESKLKLEIKTILKKEVQKRGGGIEQNCIKGRKIEK